MVNARRFDGAVVYVTGAGDGIGRATALRLAAEGAAIGIMTLDPNQAEDVAAECRDMGAAVVIAVGDLGDADFVSEAHQQVVEALGPADILINNVAVGIEAPFLELTDADFERTFAVNFMAGVRLTRLVLPAMLEKGAGVLVNVASVQGAFGWPGASAYAASKGAVMSWSRQLANEFGTRGIRSNSVLPGAVLTAMQMERIAREGETSRTRSANLHIIPRLQEPEEVAAAIAFLASAEASFITGTDFRADGGTMTKAHSYL